MAHVCNRSRFRVTVKNRPELERHFPYDQIAAVETYLAQLREPGPKPRAVQLDEAWLVRIRERGHKALTATFRSESEATRFVDKTREERSRGLLVDYTAALKVSFADLIVRYLLEEAPRLAALGLELEGLVDSPSHRASGRARATNSELTHLRLECFSARSDEAGRIPSANARARLQAHTSLEETRARQPPP